MAHQRRGLSWYCREGVREALELMLALTNWVYWGGLFCPEEVLGHGGLIAGEIRSGKSLLLKCYARLLCGPVLFRGAQIARNRAFMFDPALEFEAFFKATGVPDEFLVQLYPFTTHSFGLDFQAELATPNDRRNFSKAIQGKSESKTGSDRFFYDACAAVIYGLIASFEEREARWYLADILRIVMGEPELLEHVLRQTDVGRHALRIIASSAEKTVANIQISLAAELSTLTEIAAANAYALEQGRSFSFREEFFDGTPLVFLGNPMTEEPLSRYNELVTYFFGSSVLKSDRNTAAEGFTDQTYWFVDEAISAYFPGADKLLREAPKRGLRSAFVLHDVHGLRDAWGSDKARHVIAQLAQNLAVCRSIDTETAELLAMLLGGKPRFWRDSFSYKDEECTRNTGIVNDFLVDPSEFLTWPPASFTHGFPCYTRIGAGMVSLNWVSPQDLSILIPRQRPGLRYEPLPAKHTVLGDFTPEDWKRLNLDPFNPPGGTSRTSPKTPSSGGGGFINPNTYGG